MIRKATFSDLGRLYELLEDMQRNSKYFGDVDIHEPTARSLLATAVQRNGMTNNGGALVVAHERDGAVEGFMLGMLDRLYHIGTRLQANDIYLYCTDRASPHAAPRLIDEYADWAFGNPKVAKIMLSHTDALGTDGEMIARLYKRKGFRLVGGIFERDGQ